MESGYNAVTNTGRLPCYSHKDQDSYMGTQSPSFTGIIKKGKDEKVVIKSVYIKNAEVCQGRQLFYPSVCFNSFQSYNFVLL